MVMLYIKRMKTLVIQLRDNPWKLEWEKKNFIEATGADEQSLAFVNIAERELTNNDLDGVTAAIIGGSSHGYGVHDQFPNKESLRKLIRQAAETQLPVLGICFGAQLIAESLGGAVMEDEERKEIGTYIIERTDPDMEDPLFVNVPKKFLAQCNHKYRITRLPSGSVILAKSDKCPIHAFKIMSTNLYGVQFHPERSKESFAESIQHKIGETPPDKQAEQNPPLKKILKSLKTTDTYGIVKNFLKMAEGVRTSH